MLADISDTPNNNNNSTEAVANIEVYLTCMLIVVVVNNIT